MFRRSRSRVRSVQNQSTERAGDSTKSDGRWEGVLDGAPTCVAVNRDLRYTLPGVAECRLGCGGASHHSDIGAECVPWRDEHSTLC